MAQDNRVNMPSGIGGLTRYHEEYEGKFNLKPNHVVLFIILIIALRILMPYIF